MVSGPKKRPARSASRHIGKVPLDRVGFGNIDLVEIEMGEPERASLQEFPIRRHDAVIAKLKKRRFLLGREADHVPHRFFQEQTRQRKQRICNRTGLDLRYNVLECERVWQKADRDFRRRGGAGRMPIWRAAIFRLVRTTLAAAHVPSQSIAMAPVCAGC